MAEDVATAIPHGGGGAIGALSNFTSVLLHWGLPIAGFFMGLKFKDPFQIEAIVKSLLPPPIAGRNNWIGWTSGLIAAAIYFFIAYVAWRFIPFLGRMIGAFLAGSGFNLLLAALRGSAVFGAWVPNADNVPA